MKPLSRHHAFAKCFSFARFAGAGGLALMLAACSGGGIHGNAPESGTEIVTPSFESYTTDDNGYTRVRLQEGTSSSDQAVLDKVDAGDSPNGYKNLISLSEAKYTDNMRLEVIAQVDDDGNPTRILRMTADQAPFDNVDDDGNLIASGKYYFRGSAQVYATVDGGDLQVGVGDLENLVVDFDTQTVSIDLRTPYDPDNGSDIETELSASGLSLNVLTGTFGGTVTMTTRSASDGTVLSSSGELRGNLNGDEAGLSRLVEDMTTSGLFTVGSDSDAFQADGIFWGSQLNYDN